jgi:hypothetical protein
MLANKHISTAMNEHARIEVLLGMVFLQWSMARSYKWGEVKPELS